MAYKFFNPNPCGRNVGDCSVRAIAKALGLTWEEAYIKIMINGYRMCDMPSSDSVWGSVLRQNGFTRQAVSDKVPDCYTAEDFLKDHPDGVYVLGFGGHVATAINGDLYDSWDSSHEIPQFYWEKKGE
jgi:hypothetical protein